MDSDRAFCEAMLPKVSRTFALCIKLLPRDLEYPVLLAYLLCRIADTIEDTEDLPGARKQELLSLFSSSLEPDQPAPQALQDFFDRQQSDEERLAANTHVVLREYTGLPEIYRDRIKPWVQEMCSGMGAFAADYDTNGARSAKALRTVEELERYCYYVAGTVGHMLTELYPVQRPTIDGPRTARMKSLATSFGLGLQLTNIIKDVGDDNKRGWIYVPEQLCEEMGIKPDDLHDQSVRPKARAVMLRLIEKAETHLRDALDYCTTIPRGQYGIRLFCLTSLFFAVRTLRLAREDERLLDPTHKVKISRRDVYWTVGVTRCFASSNGLVRAYYRHLSHS